MKPKPKRPISNLNTVVYCNRCGRRVVDRTTRTKRTRLVNVYINAHYPSVFRVCPDCADYLTVTVAL